MNRLNKWLSRDSHSLSVDDAQVRALSLEAEEIEKKQRKDSEASIEEIEKKQRKDSEASSEDVASSDASTSSIENPQNAPPATRWKAGTLPAFFPLADLMRERQKNTYSEVPASDFLIRGRGYIREGKKEKVHSQPAAYELVGINFFKSKRSLFHIAARVESLKNLLAGGPANSNGLPSFLVISFVFSDAWSGEHSAVVVLFKRREGMELGEGFERAFRRFVESEEHAAKADRLKFMFKVQEARSAIKGTIAMLGGERPVLIAKKLTTHFIKGANYLEFDQDVGSSKIACMLNSTMLKASGSMVVDMAWLCEAKEEDELPECLLGTLRFFQSSFYDVSVDLDIDAPLDRYLDPEQPPVA